MSTNKKKAVEKDEKEEKGYRGRKPSLLCDDKTITQIHSLGALQCTQEEAAGVLCVHLNTFKNFMKDNEGAREAWDDGQQSGKVSLRRNQFKQSQTNPTMAIWLGKQLLGQKDDVHHHHSGFVEVKDAADQLHGKLSRMSVRVAAEQKAKPVH